MTHLFGTLNYQPCEHSGFSLHGPDYILALVCSYPAHTATPEIKQDSPHTYGCMHASLCSAKWLTLFVYRKRVIFVV